MERVLPTKSGTDGREEMIQVLIKAGANIETDTCVAKQKELDVQLLQEGIKEKVNYKGFVEGFDIGSGTTHVVVSDGRRFVFL